MPKFEYKDKWIRLLGIPAIAFAIVHIGRVDAVSKLLRNPSYYTDLVFAILLISLVWFLIKRIIIRLDRYKTWRQAPLERATLQLAATIPLILLLGMVTEIVYLEFFLDIRVENSSLFNHDLPLAFVFTLLVNLIYALLQLLEEPASLNQSDSSVINLANTIQDFPQAAPQTESIQRIVANLGDSQFPIAVDEIAYFYLDTKIVFAKTFEGKSYILDLSLEKIYEQLPPAYFFRANKQCIIHVKSIRKYVTEANRNLYLELIPPAQTPVTVNKNRALAFKEWLQR